MFTGDTLIAQSWLPYIISNLLPMLHRLHEGLLSYSGSYTFPDGSTAHIGTAFGHTTTVIWGKPVPVQAITATNYFLGAGGRLYSISKAGLFKNLYSNVQGVASNIDVGITATVTDAATTAKNNWIASVSTTSWSLGFNGVLKLSNTASLVSGDAPGQPFDVPDCAQMMLCRFLKSVVAVGASLSQAQFYVYASKGGAQGFQLLKSIEMPFPPDIQPGTSGVTITGIAAYNNALYIGVSDYDQSTFTSTGWIYRTTDLVNFEQITMPSITIESFTIPLIPSGFVTFQNKLLLGYGGAIWLTGQDDITNQVTEGIFASYPSGLCVFNGQLYGIAITQVESSNGLITTSSIYTSPDGFAWNDAGVMDIATPSDKIYTASILGLLVVGKTMYAITSQQSNAPPWNSGDLIGSGPVDLVVLAGVDAANFHEVFRQNIYGAVATTGSVYTNPAVWGYVVPESGGISPPIQQ